MSAKKNTAADSGTPKKGGIQRRDVLKGLATVPVLGVFAAKLAKKRKYDATRKDAIMSELGLKGEAPTILPASSIKASSKEIRVGMIGYGSRGEYLMRAAGYAHPSWLESMKQAAIENSSDRRYTDFMDQDDLNIVVTGVCDVFDIRAQKCMEAVSCEENPGKAYKEVKRYRTYKQLINSPEIDAVIIATPEHWHAPMAIEACKAGKHVYLEKPFTKTIPEVYELVDAIDSSGIKFQLGHQGRQTDAYMMAKEVVNKGILGKVSLVTVTTNRNDPNGAWVYNIHPEASPFNIDLRQFRGKTPRKPDQQMIRRFFQWRLWYDYGTGLSGDLFTHEFDSINMILDLGIPKSAVASGGIYYYKDGREVPDVYQAVYEYPDRDLTLMYSATLSNQTNRGKLIMGSDAVLDLGQLHASAMSVTADAGSQRYKEKIDSGLINTSLPMFTFTPGSKGLDAVTSATEKYFAGRGLLYTYRDGKRYDTTNLHILEWLEAIRTDGETSCGAEHGRQEAITAHMGTMAYLSGKKVEWDSTNNCIVES